MPPTPAPRSPLEQSALQEAAGPDWSVELHAVAPSTNLLATSAPVARRVVVADHQAAGRGRLDRSWETPPGVALTFSAVVDPQLEARWWPVLPLMAGLAVARAIGPAAGLKWPNDVQVDGRKVCGILVERVEARSPLAVIGIGINVDQAPHELPVDTATSLAVEGLATDRTALFGDVLAGLRRGLGDLLADPHGVMAAYRGRSVTLDRDVRVAMPDGSTLAGRVFDIDDSGQLVVFTGSSDPAAAAGPGAPDPADLVAVSAGDVVHVRPAG